MTCFNSGDSSGSISLANFHLHHPEFADPMGYPAGRPDDLPSTVLWNYNDCMNDTNRVEIFTSGNPNRPCMEKALRNKDGTLLTTDAYNRVRSTVRAIAAQLLRLPAKLLPGQTRDTGSRTKRYFTNVYPQEWTNALRMVEYMQPVTQMCSAHWKADHLLSQHLRNISSADNDEDRAEHKRRRAKSTQGEQSSQAKPSSSGKLSEVVPYNYD